MSEHQYENVYFDTTVFIIEFTTFGMHETPCNLIYESNCDNAVCFSER